MNCERWFLSATLLAIATTWAFPTVSPATVSPATVSPATVNPAAENRTNSSNGPGGVSRALHVKCGFYSPGSQRWSSDHDLSIAASGYRYSVAGNSYRGSYPNGYCWFFEESGIITIHCPSDVEGTLFLYFLDMNDTHRRQLVTVERQPGVILEEFLQPHGKWSESEISKRDTTDGKIVVEIALQEGANAVISRIDFVPHDMKGTLSPEPNLLDSDSTDNMV